MDFITYTLQIQKTSYNYVLLPIQEVDSFLTKNKLHPSMEELLKNHRNGHYSLSKFIKEQSKYKRPMLLFILYKNQQVLFVARHSDSQEPSTTYLDCVITHPDYRRQKVATYCLHALTFHRKKQIHKIKLVVFTRNKHAIHLYQQLQFHISSINTKYNCLTMTLVLDKYTLHFYQSNVLHHQEPEKWYVYKKHVSFQQPYLTCLEKTFLKKSTNHSSHEPNKKDFLPNQQLYVFQIQDHCASYYIIIL